MVKTLLRALVWGLKSDTILSPEAVVIKTQLETLGRKEIIEIKRFSVDSR